METACIRSHFQPIKYPIAILYILRIYRWWQVLFMIPNLRRDMATAALHFALRTTSNNTDYGNNNNNNNNNNNRNNNNNNSNNNSNSK